MNRRAILKRVLLVLACWYPVTLFYWEVFAYRPCRNVAWDTARSMGMSYGDDGYQEFVDYLCPPVGEFLEFPMGFVTSLGYFAANPFVTIPSLLISIFLVALGSIVVRRWESVKRIGRYLTFGYLHRKWRRLIWTLTTLAAGVCCIFGLRYSGEEEWFGVALGIVAACMVGSFVTEPFVSNRKE